MTGGKHGVTRDKAGAGPPERLEEGVTLSKQGGARAFRLRVSGREARLGL